MILTLSVFLGGVLAGWLGGAMAGLAGLGGGLIYTPFYLLIFSWLVPDAGQGLAALAVSASLMAVALTGVLSSRVHWQLQHVDAVTVVRLSPLLLLGAALGLWTTFRLHEGVVLLILAGLDFWLAWDVRQNPDFTPRPAPSRVLMLPIGYVSGVIGIGGGTMLMPLLRRSMPLARAVGTTAVCGTVMVLGANAIHALLHPAWRGMVLDVWSVLAASCLGILLSAKHGARWAAMLHHRCAAHRVRLWIQVVFLTLAVSLSLAAVLKLQ